tara:strand:- start:32 stop:247 length:216 start_codon:yes stop_codon:yes gene_type:complete
MYLLLVIKSVAVTALFDPDSDVADPGQPSTAEAKLVNHSSAQLRRVASRTDQTNGGEQVQPDQLDLMPELN